MFAAHAGDLPGRNGCPGHQGVERTPKVRAGDGASVPRTRVIELPAVATRRRSETKRKKSGVQAARYARATSRDSS